MADGYDLGTAWIHIALDTKTLAKDANRALGNIDPSHAQDKIRTGFGEAFRSAAKVGAAALSTLGVAGVVAGLGSVASEALKASDATQKFASTLTFAGKSADEISALKKSAKAYADQTVYDLADIQNATAQLAANNVKDFDRLVVAAGNLNAVAGGNADTFKSVNMVLTQTAGQGKLTTENFNQLADAIPGASGRLQEALAANAAYTGDFRKAMADGQITAEEFNQAVMDLGMTDAAAQAATSTTTMEGAWGNFQATLVSGALEIADTVMPTITGALGTMSDKAGKAFTWVNGTLIPSARSLYTTLFKGDYSGPIFGLEEDSPLVGLLLTLREQALGAADRIRKLSAWVSRNKDLLSALAVSVGTVVAAIKVWSTVTRAQNALNAAGGVMAWVKATNLARTAQIALNVVMSANPVGLIVTAIATLTAGLVWFFTQTETGQRLWDSFTQRLSTAGGVLGSLRDVVTGIGQSISEVWGTKVMPALTAAWQWLTGTLVPALQQFWSGTLQPALTALAAMVVDVWQTKVLPALSALHGFVVTTLAPALVSFWQEHAQPALEAFGSLVASVWANVVGPTLRLLWSFITGVLAPTLMWLWTNIVSPVFSWVGSKIADVWTGVVSPALTALWSFLRDVLAPTLMWLWTNIVSPVFSWVGDKISTVVGWVTDTVLPKIGTAIDAAASACSGFKDTVASAFTSVKAAAAKPINFVIGTVYTDGLKALIEGIAEKIGLDITLPTVAKIPGYAGGGVLPGYAPGRDSIPAMLSPGEAVLVPELVRQIGADRIIAANYAASRRAPGGSPGYPATGFSGGGVAHFAGGGIAGWFADKAKGVMSFLTDPLTAVTDLITTPVTALLDAVPGSGVFKDVSVGLVRKALAAVPDFFKKSAEQIAPAAGSGLVAAAMRAVTAGIPYVWGGSTSAGLDCSGLVYWAAQQVGLNWPRLTAAGYQAASVPLAKAQPGDLLFWGSPASHVAIAAGDGMMIEEPRPGLSAQHVPIRAAATAGRYGLYDSGGYVQPGLTTVLNASGRPEPVLTSAQWDDVSSLVSRIDTLVSTIDSSTRAGQTLVVRDVDDQLVGRMRTETISILAEAL